MSSNNVASHLAMQGRAAARIQRSPFFLLLPFYNLKMSDYTCFDENRKKRNTEKTFGLIGCEKYNEIERRFSREIAKYTGVEAMQLPQKDNRN